MTEELDIEETSKYSQLGIIVLRNGTHRTYYRPRKLSLEESVHATIKGNPLIEFELVPLSAKEKAELNIVEESEHQDGSEFDIEEAEHGEESEIERKLRIVRDAEEKAKHTVNMSDPESIRAAKEILSKQENKLAAQAIGEDVKSVLQAKFRDKDVEPPKIETKEDYENAVKLYKALPEKHAPSGIARCDDPRQMGISQDLFTKKYEGATKEDAYKNMIEELREQSHRGSKEAESYLNSLWEIALKPEVKENQHAYAPKTDEIETRTTSEGFKVSTDETDIQRMFRKWREDRLRKMGKINNKGELINETN